MKNVFATTVSALLSIISSLLGLFYTFGGETRDVENIYGQTITLFGDGIYKNDSVFKVAITKGTDIAVVIVALLLLVTIVFLRNKQYAPFIQVGLLSIILYATTCLIMGTTFNNLFLLYLLQFSFLFFTFIFTLYDLLSRNSFKDEFYKKKLYGTALFLIISGLSVLQWLAFIIPAITSKVPMKIIDVYTTEPTFVIDLAIILPTAIYCSIMLITKKTFAYQLAPVLLILLTGVALCVICQTIVQSILGVSITLSELIGLVIVFVILGSISIFINFTILRNLKNTNSI